MARLFERLFYCEAQDGAVWKVCVADERTSKSEITLTVLVPGRPNFVKIFHGTPKLVLESQLTEGGGGYPLTDRGRREMFSELCYTFLSRD